MDNITDTMQAFTVSGPPSSLSSSSTTTNTLANTSTATSCRSSATSISPATSEAPTPSRKPSLHNNNLTTTSGTRSPKTSSSEESILDDDAQGHIRAMRRRALARKISAHLQSLPSTTASSSSSSSGSGTNDNVRRNYVDRLIATEPELYTPALAAYFGDHPDAIPERDEDEATQRRKRYDAHEVVTDRYGRATRIDARQQRLFQGWEWAPDDSPTSGKARRGNPGEQGPMGEHERGDDVHCTHCERQARKDEMRRVAKKGFSRLIGRKSKAERNAAAATLSADVGKHARKAVVEDEAEHAEQVERVVVAESRPYGTIRVR